MHSPVYQEPPAVLSPQLPPPPAPIQVAPLPVPAAAMATPTQPPPVVAPIVPPAFVPQPPVLNPILHEKRRSIKPPTLTKKSKKNRTGTQVTTKDLGRWKPIDDLSLIVGIQQTNDLRTVHRGVKFSCKFTVQEMQNRWYSLLYDEPISRIAVAAMRNLHPELVESVHSRALYTAQEEELLGTIKSVRF